MKQKIFDTHLHVWDRSSLEIPWLKKADKKIKKDFFLKDYKSDQSKYNISHLNYVEVDVKKDQLDREATNTLNTAGDFQSVVLGADLTRSNFINYIKKYCKHKKVVGIRHGGGDFNNGDIYTSKEFIQNVNLLSKLNLHCEILAKIDHMKAVNNLIKSCPDTFFIINHCGSLSPFEKDKKIIDIWLEGMKSYASNKKVFCKISGLIQNIGRTSWNYHDLSFIVNECINIFGENRVIFGSNWPVCNLYGGSLEIWISSLERILENRSESFREKIFFKNAEKIFIKKTNSLKI